jgi:hypothetical protein
MGLVVAVESVELAGDQEAEQAQTAGSSHLRIEEETEDLENS